MKRTILLLILLSAIGIQVSAQFRQKEGDPIDYSRIRLPREPGSHPLTYTIYSEDFMVQIPLAFKGELIRTREVGPSLLEKAVQMALERTGTTRAQIAKWNEQVKMAKEINYSMDDFLNELSSMTGGGFGPVEVGNIMDLLLFLGGYKDFGLDLQTFQYVGKGAANFAEYLSETAAEKAKENSKWIEWEKFKTGEYIAGTISRFMDYYEKMEIFLKARERDKQKWDNRIANYAAEGLARFYKEANHCLRQIAKGEDIRWMLLVEGSVNAPVRYEGVKCVQQWTLKMQLDKMYPLDDEEAERNFFNTFQGKYYGMLEAEAVYDFSNYDSQYLVEDENSLAKASLGNNLRMMANVYHLVCKKNGVPFNFTQKKTQAVCQYKIPVLVTLDPGKEPRDYIYGSTKYFLGEEELMGEKPQPDIDVKLQMFRKFEVDTHVNGLPNSRLQANGHEYVSGDMIYVGFYQNLDLTTSPENVFELVGTLTWKSAAFQNQNDSARVDESQFATMPNGTLQINLRESIADESTSW